MLQNKQTLTKKWVLLFAAAVLALGVLSGCGKKSGAGNAAADTKDVVATYKGGTVTTEEFDKFQNVNKVFYPQYAQFAGDPSYKQEMLKQYITFKVLSERLDAKDKPEADKKVKTQTDQIKSYLDMQGGADKVLKDNKIEMKDLEQFVQRSLYSLTAMESKVTDDQVKAEYDKKLAADKEAYTVATVSHILVALKDAATQKDLRTADEALNRAKEVQDKLSKGGDFAALAKEYSDDPGSKDKGGKYENADISQWVPEFKKAAAELPLNQVSDPVKTDYGYHVMKVESRTTKKLDDVKADIKSGLAEQLIYNFAEKELPGLIETNNLPKPQPAQPAQPNNGGQAPSGSQQPAPATPAPDQSAPQNTPAPVPAAPNK